MKPPLPDTFSLLRVTIKYKSNNIAYNTRVPFSPSLTLNFQLVSGNKIIFDKIQLEGKKHNKWYTIGYCIKKTIKIPA